MASGFCGFEFDGKLAVDIDVRSRSGANEYDWADATPFMEIFHQTKEQLGVRVMRSGR